MKFDFGFKQRVHVYKEPRNVLALIFRTGVEQFVIELDVEEAVSELVLIVVAETIIEGEFGFVLSSLLLQFLCVFIVEE